MAGMHFRFAPPNHLAGLVARPALLEALDVGARRRLVVVQSPAGYGKTVLLSQWCEDVRARGGRAVWVALDRDDTSADCVGWIRGALAEAGLIPHEPARASIHAVHGPGSDEAALALLYELQELDDDLTVILDDYHLAQGAETDAVIDRLLKEAPPRIHFVLATRTRPNLSLARLRARGQFEELTAEDLRFADAEAADLLQADLSQADAAVLNQFVGGWPLALQLAKYWVRRRGDVRGLVDIASGSIGDVAAFLAAQMIDELPPSVRDLLVESSILDQLDPETVDAVRGRSDSARLLEELRGLNVLLAPADSRSRAFRHHHLFAEFLQARQTSLPKARVKALHRAASLWFERVGDPLRAVRHAQASGDEARAQTLVETACTLWLCLTQAPRAKAMLNLLSSQRIAGSCRLLLVAAITGFKEGDLRGGQLQLERAQVLRSRSRSTGDDEGVGRDLVVVVVLRAVYQDAAVSEDDLTQLEALTGPGELYDPWLHGLIFILRCLIHLRRGELTLAKGMIFQAIRSLRDVDGLYARMFSNLHLGAVALAQGQLAEAQNAYHLAEEMALEYFPGDAAFLAITQMMLGEVAYERNDLDRASELLQENLRLLETSEIWSEIYISAYEAAVSIAQARGDVAAAELLISRAETIGVEKGLMRLQQCALAQRITLLVRAGRLEAAQVLARRAQSPVADTARTWVERDAMVLALARLATADGRGLDAIAALEIMEAQARTQGRDRALIRAQATRALALRSVGQTAEAKRVLAEALEAGRIEGVVRSFVDEGAAMQGLLEDIAAGGARPRPHGALAKYIDHLLDAFDELPRQTETTRLIQLLTPRERQILQQLAQGASNKVIARSLGLTEDGIKYHLKNAYRKLGVASRVMALNIVQKLNMLP